MCCVNLFDFAIVIQNNNMGCITVGDMALRERYICTKLVGRLKVLVEEVAAFQLA